LPKGECQPILAKTIDALWIYIDQQSPQPAMEPYDSKWKSSFRLRILELSEGYKAERALVEKSQAGGKIVVREWLSVRMISISIRPFWVFVRMSFNLDPELCPALGSLGIFGADTNIISQGLTEEEQDLELLDWNTGGGADQFSDFEFLNQLIMGIQNDIIGFEKDHLLSYPLNIISVLHSQGVPLHRAMERMIKLNRVAVEKAMGMLPELEKKWGRGSEISYCRSILGELPSYAKWTRDSMRYRLPAVKK